MYRESATTFAKSNACRTLLYEGKGKEREKKESCYKDARIREDQNALGYMCPREDEEPVQAEYELRDEQLSYARHFPRTSVGCKTFL